MHDTAIVWFRRDLRLADNPALSAATEQARSLIAVASEPPAYSPGSAALEWRAHSLAELHRRLEAKGSGLYILDGPMPESLVRLAQTCGVGSVYANRCWDPGSRAEESAARAALDSAGITLKVSESAYLSPPHTIATSSGAAYRVFTPYFRAWERAAHVLQPLGVPTVVPRAPDTSLPPTPHTPARVLGHGWRPGEGGALERLASFAAERLGRYDATRDMLATAGTSELSPHLAAGEITPRQVLWAVRSSGAPEEHARAFTRQLAWREFAAGVMESFPRLATDPLREEFVSLPWRDDDAAERAWREGRTGYPIVDAGMRQLAETGWMHNRARLVAASFFTKDLLLPWQRGEQYFRDTLIDYDPAQNAFNWQWVAGCGADAAPYFRIFNPTVQAQRFDPQGVYARRWLGDSPAEYPEPIIDHAEARLRALAAYESIRA